MAMKGRDALSYCRQLLVEQKVTHVWLSVDRHSLLAALERWRAYPALDGTAVSAERWREEVEHERAKALERSSLHAKQLQKCQARLNAAEGVVAQLREDNSTLRAELAELRGHQEFNDEQLAALRNEKTQRAAASTRAVMQEKALRKQLEAEERRLADGAAQLVALETMAQEDEAALRKKQISEERAAKAARESAIAQMRREGGSSSRHGSPRGGGSDDSTPPAPPPPAFAARLAWHAAYAHARLMVTWERHEQQIVELEQRLGMLDALRESRDALEWKVTRTKASLIVLRSGLDDPNTPGKAPKVKKIVERGEENAVPEIS